MQLNTSVFVALAKLEQLERMEEALIEAAMAQGLNIVRRADASPAAVLGIAVRQREAIAA